MFNANKFVSLSALLLALSTMAAADVISYSSTFSEANAATTSFGLQSFDTSLGTLTGVAVEFDYTPDFGFFAFSIDGTPQSFTDVGGTFSFQLNGPDGLTLGDSESYFTSGTVDVGNFYESPVVSHTQVLNVASSGFGDFETPPAGAMGSYSVTATPAITNFPNSSLEFSIADQDVDGTTTVTYTYTSSAVPEPAPVAVLGVGALGLLLRKRRN